MVNITIDLGRGLVLRNPVMTASGTFGYGEEYTDFVDLAQLGGIIVKGTTLHPREGNPYPRMAETPSGMLNCVGLQNKGVQYFIDIIYPRIKDFDTNVLLNLSGSTLEDYVKGTEMVDALEKVPAIELNVSCPNVKQGGMAFGVTTTGIAQVVSEVRKVYHKHLMVKLSPNVTNIAEIALAAETAGADSVSLINTLMGMAIDAEKRKPKLSVVTGGLSGACVKPVALRMVWQVAKAVKIPVVGLGGISNATDALDKIPAIELNVSCPNVKQGGMAFGVTTTGISQVVSEVRKVYHKHLMVKLSPNVTNIAEIAMAAEAAGADSVSLINTLMGMAIDAEKRKPKLSVITGGLSGACVKPVALRMVWQVAKAVKIPVVGLGGISNASDAVEFMLAGASAIEIGTANFIDPAVSAKVAEGMKVYCERHGFQKVTDLIGALEC